MPEICPVSSKKVMPLALILSVHIEGHLCRKYSITGGGLRMDSNGFVHASRVAVRRTKKKKAKPYFTISGPNGVHREKNASVEQLQLPDPFGVKWLSFTHATAAQTSPT